MRKQNIIILVRHLLFDMKQTHNRHNREKHLRHILTYPDCLQSSIQSLQYEILCQMSFFTVGINAYCMHYNENV